MCGLDNEFHGGLSHDIYTIGKIVPCKLIKAKVDDEDICELGTFDAAKLQEYVFFTFI